MKSYIYRPATYDDLDSLMEIKNRVYQSLLKSGKTYWDEDYPSREIFKNDIDLNGARVLEVNGKIATYISFRHLKDRYGVEGYANYFSKANIIILARLMTDTLFAGQGLAYFLMKEVTEEITNRKDELSIEGIGLEVYHENMMARHIYEKAGYRLTDKAIDYPFGRFLIYEILF